MYNKIYSLLNKCYNFDKSIDKLDKIINYSDFSKKEKAVLKNIVFDFCIHYNKKDLNKLIIRYKLYLFDSCKEMSNSYILQNYSKFNKNFFLKIKSIFSFEFFCIKLQLKISNLKTRI